MKLKRQVKRAKQLVERYLPFRQLLEQRQINTKFAQEILLLQGGAPANNNNQSILFFTTHKCASVYVGMILKKLIKDTSITPIDLDNYFWRIGTSKENIREEYSKAIKSFGYLYAPLRSPDECLSQINSLDNYKVLLMLRDPRDVLTSMYFSVAYSHYVPTSQKDSLLTRRENIQQQAIDEFVIDDMPNLLKKYNACCQRLLGEPNVLFVKYEDMVTDFSSWLDSIINFLQFDVSQETVSQLTKEANFDVKEEDIYSHKRQVTPGDHKRKLAPETIKILNSEFGEVLDLLGYER